VGQIGSIVGLLVGVLDCCLPAFWWTAAGYSVGTAGRSNYRRVSLSAGMELAPRAKLSLQAVSGLW